MKGRRCTRPAPTPIPISFWSDPSGRWAGGQLAWAIGEHFRDGMQEAGPREVWSLVGERVARHPPAAAGDGRYRPAGRLLIAADCFRIYVSDHRRLGRVAAALTRRPGTLQLATAAGAVDCGPRSWPATNRRNRLCGPCG